MLDAQPTVMQRLVGPLLLPCQFPAAWFLGRQKDPHLGQRERQEAQSLSQPAPGGPGIRGRVGHALLRDAAAVGVAQPEEQEQRMDQQDIVDGVILFRHLSNSS